MYIRVSFLYLFLSFACIKQIFCIIYDLAGHLGRFTDLDIFKQILGVGELGGLKMSKGEFLFMEF